MRKVLRAIKRNCDECSFDLGEPVAFCRTVDCPFWEYRMGMEPREAKRKFGKEIMDRDFVRRVMNVVRDDVPDIRTARQFQAFLKRLREGGII